jgi:hypothetical protein
MVWYGMVYGGSTRPLKLRNNSKPMRKEISPRADYSSAETEIYNAALTLFNDGISKAGCDNNIVDQ